MSDRILRKSAGADWLLRTLWATNPPLAALAASMVGLLVVTGIGLLVDQRVISGAPAWLKPTKFALSVAIYSITLLWLLGFVARRRLLVWVAGTVTALAFAVEMIIIVAQVIRGRASHFNASTSFDALLFSIMGLAIIVLWVMGILVGVLLLAQRFQNRALAWGTRLGMLAAVVGMLAAVPMVDGPTPDQRARLEAGERPAMIGAHSVGVEDGGPGLPITGWSTEGGDLRVAHFVGLHGMQLLPLLGWLLSRTRRLRERQQVALTVVAAGGYLGLMALLWWQALRGQPLLAPDPATWRALAALVVAVALAGIAVAWRPAPSRRGDTGGAQPVS